MNEVEILLVEDNPNDIRLALHVFRRFNLDSRVKVVRDGSEAIEYLCRTDPTPGRSELLPPRLVLLDLKLPLVDGLEVLQRIKSDSRTRAIPVVVLSSSREESDRERSYQLGVNSYIVKPVDFDQFMTVLQQATLYWLLLNEVPWGEAGDVDGSNTPIPRRPGT